MKTYSKYSSSPVLSRRAANIADELSDWLGEVADLPNVEDYLDDHDMASLGYAMDALYDFAKDFATDQVESSTSIKASVDSNYFDKFDSILEKYMPSNGEGESFASQVVTAVNKIIYKWYNDGDVYDNNYGMPGWANDLSDYANWLYTYIDEPALHRILDLIYSTISDGQYEDILQKLAGFCLDEDRLSNWADLPKEGSIYNCNGPFSFNEDVPDYRDYPDDEEEGY